MLMSLNVAFFLIVYLAVLVGIPVLIGVYVYRDASRRGMNAVLWTSSSTCWSGAAMLT